MRDGSRGQSIARSATDKLTARDEAKTKHSKLSEVVKLAIEFFLCGCVLISRDRSVL